MSNFLRLNDLKYWVNDDVLGWRKGVLNWLSYLYNDALHIAWYQPRWWIQRAKWGFSYHDAWDYFTWNAEVNVRLFDYYLKEGCGHPCLGQWATWSTTWDEYWADTGHNPCLDCTCSQAYRNALTTMRNGFQRIADDELYADPDDWNKGYHPEVTKALELFREHYMSLWL